MCPFCYKKFRQMKSAKVRDDGIVDFVCVCGAKGSYAGKTSVNKRGGKPEDYNPDRSLV